MSAGRDPSIMRVAGLIGFRVPSEPVETRLTSLDQMPAHTRERLQHTLTLARNAHYLPFIKGGGPANISVRGAALQDRSAPGGTVRQDGEGRTVYKGLQAAHLPLGSYVIDGEPAHLAWYAAFVKAAAARHLPVEQAYEGGLVGHGHHASISAIVGSWTRLQDALINQTFGAIEQECHRELGALNLSSVCPDEDGLARDMKALNVRFYEVVPAVMLRVAEERYRRLKHGLIKERVQDNDPSDAYRPVFKTESEILDYQIAELRQPGSATRFEIDAAAQGSDQSVDFDMLLVSKAKEEAAAP